MEKNMSEQGSEIRWVREEWVGASHFHDLAEEEVLALVKTRARAVQRPVVLLDLDSTLYEVGPRTWQILKEWLDTPGSQVFGEVRVALQNMRLDQVGYSLRDTFRNLGIDEGLESAHRALEVMKPFWAKRFFSSQYLSFDRPYPGAARFVQELYAMGLEIIYLTGRDEPNMGDGTRANLVRDEFPWGEPRTHLLMKDRFESPDLDHKLGAAQYVRQQGTLVASFENEPANLVALHQAFPDAMHVFVETVFSDHGAPQGNGLYRIRGFGSSLMQAT